NFLILGVVLAVSAHPADPTSNDGAEGTASTRRFHGGLRWVSVGLAAILAGIVLKVAYVQVLRADDVLTRGCIALQADGLRRFEYNPRLAAIAATIPRGSIVDRNGILLATSDPAELAKGRDALSVLGATVPASTAPGERIYPFGGRTFHLLGDLRNRVNWAARNTSFIERDSRVRLQGYDDYAAVVEVRQPGGRPQQLIQLDYHQLIPLLRYRYRPDSPAVRRILEKDRTVRLSIDVRLQIKAGDILERAVRQARQAGQTGPPEVTGGAAVVLDAVSGELLASVGYPWPARLPVESSADAASGVIDRARYGVYPPGSTFKLVTAMAALRRNPESMRRTFECVRLPEGRVGNTVRGWNRPVRDDPTDTVPHGTVDLEKGIVVSCNAYFAQLATYEVEAKPLLETARLLGIAVAKPNTPEQLLKALPQAGYGQGQVTATPFEMARVAAIVGGGGAMPEGRWVLDDSNGRTAPPAPIVSAEAAVFLARAMRRVVIAGTAARFLKDVQPAVAGKTGTAEVQGKTSHSWFVGFAPAASASGTGGGRRIAIAVIVEHGGYGGRLAAPAAGEIVRQAAALGLIR
ncbi:MAG TPA: penicillin-binding transpeptidase domain-containing protein, partial [Thermoanaerobaculia bacterium]|nr:penicillin-binding transpeptidase domain-containing protein [Thermoanaerobaculia bacterium]